MKKIIILFFVFCFKTVLGQTYTLNVFNAENASFCNGSLSRPETYWSIGGYNIGNEPVGNSEFWKNFTIKATKPSRTNPYNIHINNVCINYTKGRNGIPFNCLETIDEQKTELQMITSLKKFEFRTCAFYMVFDFLPNVTIQNMKTENLCAGETLELAAFPIGFPDEVYHWQYSSDNIRWTDIPTKIINGLTTNNTPNLNIRIDDIYGSSHVFFFKDLYFRLGYGERAFTSPIKINYQPCAPIITDVQYKGPKCNGDDIQKLEITFDKALDDIKNENLYQLYLRETTKNTGPIKTTPMFSVSNVVYPVNTKTYSYANFSSFSSLENGREYEVVYQTQVNDPNDTSKKILRGTMIAAKKITYNEPGSLKFEIKKADNPTCTGDLAEVSIAVTGGTGDYKFYVDGIEKNAPKPVKETDGYYHIRGLIPTAMNSIKVMDENDCIEKTL